MFRTGLNYPKAFKISSAILSSACAYNFPNSSTVLHSVRGVATSKLGFARRHTTKVRMAGIFSGFLRKLSGSDETEEGEGKLTREALHKKERERLLQMPIEEKRKVYKCGHKYVELQNVPTWSEYFKEDSKRLLKLREKKKKSESSGVRGKLKPRKPKTDYEVNEEFNKKVSIWRGDITCLEIDAIVNAANNSLLGGGGVDGAIHSAAGSNLKVECAKLGGCDTGDAKITADVIHTVGPIGFHPDNLESCYSRCFQNLKENELKTIAFPCISTGIYGYPNDDACETALARTRQFLEEGGDKLVDRVIFCLFLPVDVKLYEELMQVYFPVHVDDVQEDGDDEEDTSVDKEKEVEEETAKKKTSTKPKTSNAESKSSPTATTEAASQNQGEETQIPDLNKAGEDQVSEGQGQEDQVSEGQGQGSDSQGHTDENKAQTTECKKEAMDTSDKIVGDADNKNENETLGDSVSDMETETAKPTDDVKCDSGGDENDTKVEEPQNQVEEKGDKTKEKNKHKPQSTAKAKEKTAEPDVNQKLQQAAM